MTSMSQGRKPHSHITAVLTFNTASYLESAQSAMECTRARAHTHAHTFSYSSALHVD